MTLINHAGSPMNADEIPGKGASRTCPNPAACPLAAERERTPGPEFCPLYSAGRCLPATDAPDPSGVDWTRQPIGWIDL